MNKQVKNRILKQHLKALNDDISRLNSKTIQTLLKEYKSDYKAIVSFLEQAYIEYENETDGFDYNKYIYDSMEYHLRQRLASRLILTYNKTEAIIDKLLNNTANQTISNIQDIKVIKAIPYEYDTHAVINKKIQGFNWVERLGRDRTKTIYEVANEIDAGLKSGQTYTQVSKRIAQRLGVASNKATTIARTESKRVLNEMKIETFSNTEETSHLQKRWLSSRDEAVRSSHHKMDNQTVGVNDYFTLPDGSKTLAPSLSGIAKEDINCRCEIIIEIK